MQESAGAARAVSLKEAIGLMQTMPQTWPGLQSHCGHLDDNALAGGAYLRELYDCYGTPGPSTAYKGDPQRSEDHTVCRRPLRSAILASVAALALAARRWISVGQLHPRDPVLDQFAVVSGARERRLTHRSSVIR